MTEYTAIFNVPGEGEVSEKLNGHEVFGEKFFKPSNDMEAFNYIERLADKMQDITGSEITIISLKRTVETEIYFE